MTSSADLQQTFEQLSRLARDRAVAVAGRVGFTDKGEGLFDPVTALDRDIERALRRHLTTRFPDDGVWGEEEGWSNAGARRHWSLDPVDGTRALICGLPTWCVLVGLLDDGDHVAGMIDCPSLGETLIAIDDVTKRDGVEVRTSGCDALVSARLATTDPFLFDGDEWARFEAVRGRALVTRYGLDALAYARIATGDIDLVIENGLKRHDLDALIPVVRGAGGTVGDWAGGNDWDAGKIVAAASRALYDEALTFLSR